ncbi:gamma-interferon-inducible lysosomal thiol reductase-like [Brevipalpus obovatus]|uniref:gamma-interferon-inducible lysosomal thiol reductase-like n=1 Tax=Brevipalpus obovatus TaxID=246614 RepID=UPI003D9EBF27
MTVLAKIVIVLGLLGANLGSIESCWFQFDLYYESKCPFCENLVGDQFDITRDLLKEITNITLVPFGNASYKKENGTYVFKCQHGPDECFGNMIHACVLKSFSYDKALDAIICLEQEDDPRKGLKFCSKKLKFDYQSIFNCANSDEGSEYLKEYADRTIALQPKHEYVPWAVINGVHDGSFDDEMVDDLRSALCNRCQDPKPQGCSQAKSN